MHAAEQLESPAVAGEDQTMNTSAEKLKGVLAAALGLGSVSAAAASEWLSLITQVSGAIGAMAGATGAVYYALMARKDFKKRNRRRPNPD